MRAGHAAVGGAVGDLLRQVHRLELVARKNAAGLRPGDYLTAVRGGGLMFHETRKYVVGESARRIDWNITARLGEPHVQVHLEERQREVIVALDVSPSMHLGTGYKTKLEHAVELAATLAVTAVESGDRLGWVIFADQVLDEGHPRGGRPQLFRALRSMLAHTEPWSRPVLESDPRMAIHAIERRRGRFVVFLISDFIDHDLPEDLKYARARHDVSLLHVYDPLEYAASTELVFPGYSPEGRGSRGPLSTPELGSLGEIQAFLRDRCGELRMAFASFPTDLPVRSGLDRFFHRKRRALRD